VSDLWSEGLWETVIRCVLHPLTVGFNMADVEVISQLPNEVSKGHRSIPK